MHAVGSGFIEKAILAEAAQKRVAPERDTHRRMCIEIDRLEYELLEFHNLMRLTACVPGGWGENGLEMGNCPRQVRRQNQPCG